MPTGRNYRGGLTHVGLLALVRNLRLQQTPPEAIFWELVRDRRFLGVKFRRQHQIQLYVADFYCHEHRLVVELDGGIHIRRQQRQSDEMRDAYFQSIGLRVYRILNEQLLHAPEQVLQELAAIIQSSGLRGRKKT